MIAEALEYLSKQARKSGGFFAHKDQSGNEIIALPDGTTRVVEPPVARIKDQLLTIADLRRWIAARDNVEVFVRHGKIDAVASRLDDAFAHRCSVSLPLSAPYLAIKSMFEAPMTQSGLVRLLRGMLAGACSPNLVTLFRSVEFRVDGNKKSEVRTSGDTLGRSINREARLGGDLDMPDELSFGLPVYAIQECEPVTIRVACDINFDVERFEFIAVGDTLQDAIDLTIRKIAAAIENDTDAKVYLGSMGEK